MFGSAACVYDSACVYMLAFPLQTVCVWFEVSVRLVQEMAVCVLISLTLLQAAVIVNKL